MKLYRFSPIKNHKGLLEAIKHIHIECHRLCKGSFGKSLPNAGNIGVFCHYDKEYETLIKLRAKLAEPSDDPNQKYFRLYEPITIPTKGNIPGATYTHIYIRKPDPYRHHVGDLDFYLEQQTYSKIKQSMLNGRGLKGARVFERTDLDMIELYNPDIDVLAYVSTKKMTQKVRVKQSEITKL
ncbi:MAG TPA: hypothetical protein VND15_03235 [Candidatus Acidoferrales bacterium]|nr:hypothetical protein [Candidatus Acidoferrales bacterium]